MAIKKRIVKFLLIFCIFTILSSLYFLISHTILKRSINERQGIFEDVSGFNSDETEISEVIGHWEKSLSRGSDFLPNQNNDEYELRKKRILKHPHASKLVEYEERIGKAIFTLPREVKITLEQALQLYEAKLFYLRCDPKEREETILYALRQQAFYGDVYTQRPWILNFNDYLDWLAWNSLRGRSGDYCKKKYIKFIKLLIAKYGLRREL